jgi:hypothetical protein
MRFRSGIFLLYSYCVGIKQWWERTEAITETGIESALSETCNQNSRQRTSLLRSLKECTQYFCCIQRQCTERMFEIFCRTNNRKFWKELNSLLSLHYLTIPYPLRCFNYGKLRTLVSRVLLPYIVTVVKQ